MMCCKGQGTPGHINSQEKKGPARSPSRLHSSGVDSLVTSADRMSRRKAVCHPRFTPSVVSLVSTQGRTARPRWSEASGRTRLLWSCAISGGAGKVTGAKSHPPSGHPIHSLLAPVEQHTFFF
jgi:hypothetical protein